MTISLNSLSRWQVLPEDGCIWFPDVEGERRIRLHLNCEGETPLYLDDGGGIGFLTTVPAGLQSVEFSVAGKVAVLPAKGAGQVHYQTAEDEPTHVALADPIIFTRIAERRARNPELEQIAAVMSRNLERRMALQADEFEARFERRRKAEENERATREANAAREADVPPVDPVRSQEPGESARGKKSGGAVGSEPAVG